MKGVIWHIYRNQEKGMIRGDDGEQVVVRKNSIRLPSDRDVGTYLFGFAALKNPRSQPRLAENTS